MNVGIADIFDAKRQRFSSFLTSSMFENNDQLVLFECSFPSTLKSASLELFNAQFKHFGCFSFRGNLIERRIKVQGFKLVYSLALSS